MAFDLKTVLGYVLNDCSFALLEESKKICFIMWREKTELTLEKLPHGVKVVRALSHQ